MQEACLLELLNNFPDIETNTGFLYRTAYFVKIYFIGIVTSREPAATKQACIINKGLRKPSAHWSKTNTQFNLSSEFN